ncbi:phosphoribosylpyrophosphate synthetase [Flavitalea antarctica]
MDLRNRGYRFDYNLKKNQLNCHQINKTYDLADVQIHEVYRFEGHSDPADEAVVYALSASNGLLGVFVDGYGIYADSNTERMFKRLM